MRTTSYRQSEKLTGLFRCDSCQKIFCNDAEVIKHEATQKHANRVRKLKMDANPDIKGYPCDCECCTFDAFDTFEQMYKHEQSKKKKDEKPSICTICNTTYTQHRGLRDHIKTQFHEKRVRHHFNQTIKIKADEKAQTWDEKRIAEKRELNRLRQARFRKRRVTHLVV